MKSKKGKLIVFEGIDGSGKTTQLDLLTEYLRSKDIPFETIDFPRYWDSFHGKTVARYLKGDFGDVDAVSPYLISLAYSLDRATAKREMNAWLREGKIVLANRYATSNMAHQAAKLPEKKRKEFLDWLQELEYRVNKIPKEDLVIYLHVPVGIARQLLIGRGKRDIHEKKFEFLTQSEVMYKKLSRRFKHWVKIDCLDKKSGILLAKEAVHKKVLRSLKKQNLI
ncbi:MAG: thymidylate kinase [Candidatus Woykebacteria bacterium]